MAIGVKRGDTVLVHDNTHGLHGLFMVDAVKGKAVTIAPPGHAGWRKGGDKSSFPTVDESSIHSVFRPYFVSSS